jgi:tetratricopeptide (TPR) repeat protein
MHSVCIILSLICACSNLKKNAREHNAKANQLLKIEDFKNASFEIEKALSIENMNPEYLFTKAKVLYGVNNYNESTKLFLSLLRMNYKADTVSFFLGLNYFSRGIDFKTKLELEDSTEISYTNAFKYFNSTIDINSRYYDAYILKYKTLHNLEKHDEALVTLMTATNLFSDKSSLLVYRGVEKCALKDYVGASTDLTKSIESKNLDSTDLATAYRFRGLCNYERKNYDNGIADFSKALQYASNNYYIYYGRGLCFQSKGLKGEACDDFRKAADLGFVGLYDIIAEYCGD